MSSSDRSRTSDDRRYNYKAVVAQQGRVIVDRDLNALEAMLGERADADVLDIIGPAGTPDNGFEISVPTSSPPATIVSPAAPQFDFDVGPGTMYVGGQRVEFPASVDGATQTYSYFSQPDWMNPDDPVPAGSPPGFPGQSPPTGVEVAWLDVWDQEVSATEDPDLKEVALGGPDTTARVRLMRRVRRTPVHETDCAGVWAEVTNTWSSQLGLAFDPAAMRLSPQVRLRVSFQTDPASTDPCDPVASGGYLYSENQLIRVQVSAAADAAGNPGRFLWGYDDASFIYRISSVEALGTQLQLADSPPDAFHQPKKGQVIEILRTAVVLGTAPDESDPGATIVRCVAEATGVTRTLSQSYGAATQGGTANYLTFTNPLPPEYQDLENPLFVRIWESEQDYPSGATSVALTDKSGATNGVLISLSTPAGVPMSVGAFWMIGLRPATPQAVYPERFLTAPQPPDGPARWACSLATIDWTTQPPTVTDCRSSFDNLVTLTKRKPGCCTVSVRPECLSASKTLQSIIDAAVSTAESVKICFAPGIYSLPASLRLGRQHANLVLEGCTEGVLLRPDPQEPVELFRDGLVVLTDAPNITLSGLDFQSIEVPVLEVVQRHLGLLADFIAVEVEEFKRLAQFEQTPLWTDPRGVLSQAVTSLATMICIRSMWCPYLTIENCNFLLTGAEPKRLNSLAIGVLAQGNCRGLALRSCMIRGAARDATPGLVATDGQFLFMAGSAGAVPAAPAQPVVAAEPAVPAAPPGKRKGARPAAEAAAAAAAGPQKPAAVAGAVAQVLATPAQLLAELPAAADFTSLAPAELALFPPVTIAIGLLVVPWIAEEVQQEGSVLFEFGEQTSLTDAQISANSFDTLTFAVASLARTGIVRVADNTATRCTAGLWFALWHGPFIKWNPVEPRGEGADQLLFYSLLYVETIIGLFAPLMLPLPQAYVTSDASIVGGGRTTLAVTGNDVDCNTQVPSPNVEGSSFALATFNDQTQYPLALDTTLTVASNSLRSRPPTVYPTVVAVVNGNLSMTGNDVANTNAQAGAVAGNSLWVDIDGTSDSGGDFVQAGLAVTGNVFQGSTNLGRLPRNVPRPLENWDVFNALI